MGNKISCGTVNTLDVSDPKLKPLDINLYDSNDISFIAPDIGTPAAKALEANAQIKVSKIEKGLNKIRVKSLMKKLNKSKNKKNKNKNKNKKKKRKQNEKNFKGKVIDGVHEQYTLAAGIMLGLRYSISLKLNSKFFDQTKEEEYNLAISIPFPAKGGKEAPFLTPPHSLAHTFVFKSYAPTIFSKIRSLCKLDQSQFLQSICGSYNFIEFISNSKSGQFFFYSHDGKYMLKTQTREEKKFLQQILPNYHEYLERNPNSFLCKILGLYRIDMYHLRRKIHFVVMANVFDTPVEIHKFYDLKGSLQGRKASDKEIQSGGILKDLDFLQNKEKIYLNSKKLSVIKQLESDANFLANLNIMDYSLLLGIHYRSKRIINEGRDSLCYRQINNHNLSIHSSDVNDAEREGYELNFNREMKNNYNRSRSSSIAILKEKEMNEKKLKKILFEDNDEYNIDISNKDIIYKLNYQELTSSEKKKRKKKLEKTLSTISNSNTNSIDSNTNDIEYSIHMNDLSSPTFSSTKSLKKEDIEFELEDEEESEEIIREEGEEIAKEDEEDEEDEDDDDDESEEEEADIDEGDSGQEDNGEENEDDMDQFLSNNLNSLWTNRLDLGINSRDYEGKRGDEIYFFGIIDILQVYNAGKKMETMVKSITYDKNIISAVDAKTYADRFIEFIRKGTV